MGSLLAGCNNSEETAGNAETTSAEGGDSEENTDTVELTAILLKHPLTQEAANMEWLQKIEEEAGVDVTYQEISADWDQVKGTLLASGDVPDLIIGAGGLTDADFVTYKGLFTNLSEYISEENTPNIYNMFQEKPILEKMSTQLDGNIYSLPKYQQYWPATGTRQFINQQWLTNLGLEEPTTLDELYDVLLAFNEQDANENGDPNDEIPMDWAPSFGYYHALNMLGGAGITLSEGSYHGYYADNGVVQNFFTDDRYKELVKFLNKCYSAGLINSEVFTQDYSTYQSLARGSGDTTRHRLALHLDGNARIGLAMIWQINMRFLHRLFLMRTSQKMYHGPMIIIP